jgi:DNA mismatch endonuclease, patch repair protein
MERLTPERRSSLMSRIKGKDTKPEIVVRSLVHCLGHRFRLHRRTLPGTPDLVFPGHKKVIFVHGCFWHMHTCLRGTSTPVNNAAFWRAKRTGNVVRDAKSLAALRKDGWKVLIVWECETRNAIKLTTRITKFLSN